MKAIFTALMALACAAVLVMGNLHWNEKTTIAGDSQQEKKEPLQQEAYDSTEADKLLSLAKNWPEQSQAALKKALQEDRPFNIVIAGSEILSVGENSWSTLLTNRLQQGYGDAVNIAVKTYDLDSLSFQSQGKIKDITSEKPDLVLLEPFTLNDNGVVTIEDSLAAVTNIIEETRKTSPKAIFILQPSYPLYNATYYPIQVEELKKYASSKGLTYINHWSVWPDGSSEEIKEYLSEDLSRPNDKGIQLWADYVADFLVKNES
jgi:lysophospholipase L1-like esterase